MPVRTASTDKDAYVDAGSPDTNFGGALSLFVRFQTSVLGGNDRETLVGFDLSSIFDDADVLDVVAATLTIPVQASEDDQTIECHEVDASAWTETGVTWNNKPAQGTLQDTEDSSQRPHAWSVIDAVSAAFDDAGQDRVGFVLSQPEGLDEHLHEYDSREAQGSELAQLELETTEQRRDDLDSQVTASKSGAADLSSFVEVKFFHERFLGDRLDRMVDQDGFDYDVADLAWDDELDRVWTTEIDAGAIVRRQTRDGSFDKLFEVHEDGTQLDTDALSVAVNPGGNVWVGLGSGDVVECTIDETNATLDVVQRNSAHDISPDWIDFRNDRIWLLQFFPGEVERRAVSNWAQGPTGSVEDEKFRGISQPASIDDILIMRSFGGLGGTHELERHATDAIGTVVDSWDLSDTVVQAQGITHRGKHWQGALFIGEGGDGGAHLATHAPREIDSQVRAGAVPREADLDATVTPGGVPDHADLSSSVATGDAADLSSTATPRVDGTADLASTVQPSSLDGSADLDGVVEVASVEIDDGHASRAEGRVAPTIVVDEDDMADVSGEVGTAITVDGADLRRVIQVLGGSDDWPRARATPATRLHRGDAVLYAQRGDNFAIGDVVEWGDRSWEVIGFLGWETIGDARLYQEVGLRRLATVHEARVKGTVQRTSHVDLFSEVEANVP